MIDTTKKSYLYVDYFCDLPQVDSQADNTTEYDHNVSIVVQHIQHDDDRLEDIEKDRANTETF